MRLVTLQARNFRNLQRLELVCGPRLNILVGDNGQGKTNILESICVLAQLRSFRGVGRPEMTRWGADGAHLQGTVEHPAHATALTLAVAWQGQRRMLKVQAREVNRTIDYLGHLHVLIFAADAVQVIKGAPEGRRRLLDRGLVSLQPAYLSLLQRQHMILKQRNRLLKESKLDRASLEVWNAKFAQHGAAVVQARARYVQRLNQQLAQLGERNLGQAGELRLRYQPALGPLGNGGAGAAEVDGVGDVAGTAQDLAEGMAMVERAELRAGMSLIGPQRDDLGFWLGGRDLKSYGSQGEQRLAVLLVLFGMLADLEAELGTSPVVLLDDMLAELDRRRRSLLWSFLQTIPVQVFLTGTELTADLQALGAAVPETQVWKVEGGVIIPRG